MSVSPIRCVPIARWLNVGSRSSMACPPFLNCARAFPAKPPSATASPAHEINSLLIHTLLFDREPLLGAIPHTAVGIDGPSPLLVSTIFCQRRLHSPRAATRIFPFILHNRLTTRARLFNIDIHTEVLRTPVGVAARRTSVVHRCVKLNLYDHSHRPYQEVRAPHRCGPHLL